MPSAGFEATISTVKNAQTDAFDRTVTAIVTST
jgi:hypothetical protein